MAHTYNNLYPKIYSLKNLIFAWRKARKGKTKKDYIVEFEKAGKIVETRVKEV